MLMRREVLEAIRRGEIDLQFRRWRRPSVKPGGTLMTALGVLSIGAIDSVRPEDVTDSEARRAGFADARDFLAWLDRTTPGELNRIEVRFLGEDPRVALRRQADLGDDELRAIGARLDAMDRRSTVGPWTARAMELIARHPGQLAERLAAEMGLPKQPFKERIRRLKAMGLTESLETGYRLSPRGERVRTIRASSN